MSPTIEKRYRVEPGEFSRIVIYLAGCGGTGSFAALHLARLAYASPVSIKLVFVDPDVVEEKNIGRQNFVPAEIGRAKAVALARRYSLGFGINISARVARVGELDHLEKPHDGMVMVLGCVDSPEARTEILELWRKSYSGFWWLDAGNSEHSGQIYLGNSLARRPKIDPTGFCAELPLPSVQAPELIVSEQLAGISNLSCAELLALEAQSLMINQAMADWLGVYVYRLLLGRDLDMMATYVNLERGTVRSVGVCGQAEGEIGPARRRYQDTEGVWTAEEFLMIAEGECPECAGRVATGRDTYDEQEIEIVFCPACQWQMPAERLELVTFEEDYNAHD